MGKETTSKTEKESWAVERIAGVFGGSDHHHKTTISDGHEKVEGLGRTEKESQERASDKWDKKK